MADFIEYIQLGVGSEAVPIRDPNAAPAGYGLGTTTKYLTATDDLNSITACGFYSYAYNSVPTNGFTCNNPFQYVYHLVVSIDANGTITQTITTCGAAPNDANYTVRRVKGFSEWGEWEWINPPLFLGVEYRTTERQNGLPIYAQALNMGIMPNNSSKGVYVDERITALIRVEGYCEYYTGSASTPFSTVSFVSDVEISYGREFVVKTCQDASTWYGYPIIYYLKD